MTIVDYNPVKGGYKKTCPICKEVFYGRENKIFCNKKCKSVKAYQKDKRKNSLIKKDKDAMLNNALILEKLNIEYNGSPCPLKRLLKEGFEENVPIKLILDNKSNQWKAIGQFAYRNIDDQNLIITKIS